MRSTLQLIMVSMKYDLPEDYALEKAEEDRVKNLNWRYDNSMYLTIYFFTVKIFYVFVPRMFQFIFD